MALSDETGHPDGGSIAAAGVELEQPDSTAKDRTMAVTAGSRRGPCLSRMKCREMSNQAPVTVEATSYKMIGQPTIRCSTPRDQTRTRALGGSAPIPTGERNDYGFSKTTSHSASW